MTLIEFFDVEMQENILATLILKPERTVFFGKDKRKMEKFVSRISGILKDKNITTSFSVISVNTNDFGAVREMLSSLCDTYPECVFDMLGGEEIVLAAMGAVASERNIPLYSIRPRNKKIRRILLQGDTSQAVFSVSLSTSQSIRLFGGTVTECSILKEENAIIRLWDICKKNCRGWNTATEQLSKYIPSLEEKPDFDGVTVHIPTHLPEENSFAPSYRINNMLSLLDEIQALKLAHVKNIGDQKTYTFSSPDILSFLEKSGNILEYYTLYAISRLPQITDAVSGAVIDWDHPPDADDEDDVKNEIDVLATAGTIPVFISCKNGSVDSDELYKLNTVAERFGGKYAKKLLVMSYYDVPDSFIQRAHAMNICLIRNVHQMTLHEFSKKLEDNIR